MIVYYDNYHISGQHAHASYTGQDVSETEFCLHLQVKST
jgi:hypothetical protein